MIKKESFPPQRASEQVLEFDKILNVISRFSNSDTAQKSILEVHPLNNRKDIEKRFGQIQEIQRLSQEGTPLKLSHFQDISQFIEKVKPEGAVLDSSELIAFMPVLRIISDVSLQIGERDGLPLLRELTSHLTGFPGILETMERSLDNEGNILDAASTTLSFLRTRIRSLDGRIKKRLEEIVRERKVIPFLQDNFVTKRSERWVIPIRMDSKGQVSGVVHDVSKSGETAFIEPLEIIGLANELENIIAEEKAEEIRILRDICHRIRKVADEIEAQFKTIVYLDVLNSIARFTDLLKMDVPQINDSSVIKLVRAKHPLLMLLQKDGVIKEVVPLDLSLGSENSVMVITGPNAGGKTITIKTVGLLMLMALSGIPVPADSSSAFPLVNELLVDIGDEQSIESSLSTFSAHISNISEILKKADSKTIVLIDELGTGTEPVQGASIACAILRDLKEKGSLVFATTHLTDIVGFVYRTEGMVNASMEFDRNTLTPLYRLTVGEPGQAHALDIARRYGLPESIIDFAKELQGNMNVEFYNLLSELKEKRLQYEQAFNELQRQTNEIEKKERSLKERLAGAERQKMEILGKAYNEAQDIIMATKRQMYAIIEEIKREKRREAIKKAEKTQQQVEEKLKEFRKEISLSMDEIREGDLVFVRSVGYDAKIVKIDKNHNRIKVMIGSRDIEVPLSDISLKRGKIPESAAVVKKDEETEEKIPSVLNLVGLRVDEALSRLEPFLNHASLSGLEEVTIIHGIGTGALLKAVRDYITGHPLVTQYRSGKQFEGGNGVTIVIMK
jgi:DNA mismatch repair protein MutS2